MNTTRIAIAASLGLALAGPALADDTTGTTSRTETRDQVRANVHHMLTTQGQVSDQDATEVDDAVGQHAGDHGYGPALSAAIHDALAAGCKGQCLVDVIHGINGAMDRGATADAAAKAAVAKAAHASGAPADPQARSADHRRDAGPRDAAADRVRDRTQDRGQAASHAMGGGRR